MTKKPQKTKCNQHTVPCSYLERFAGKDGKVCVFDKPTRKEFRRPAAKLTIEDYFYDTDDSSEQHIEEWFAREVEPRLISNLRHLDDQATRVRASAIGSRSMTLGKLGISFEIRASLAHNVILQSLRTRVERHDAGQAMRTALAGIGRLVAKAQLGRDPGRLQVGFGEFYLPQQQAKWLTDKEWVHVAVKVMRYPMALFLAEKGCHFYTSDNPVVLYHPDPNESPGWLVPRVEILTTR